MENYPFIHFSVKEGASDRDRMIAATVNAVFLLPAQIVVIGWLFGLGLKLAGF